jgi:GNAT superfamily N-acetyltransferase
MGEPHHIGGDSASVGEGYVLHEGREDVDFPRVASWLAGTCGSPGIPRATVLRAADGSAVVVFVNYSVAGRVACCRVDSDCATFAWLCDVFVDPAPRKRGLSRAMVTDARAHPCLQGLRCCKPATGNAGGISAELGFVPLLNPERWMVFPPGAGAGADNPTG